MAFSTILPPCITETVSQTSRTTMAGAIIGAYGKLGMRVSYSFALRDQNRMIYADDAAFIDMLPPDMRARMAAYLGGFALPIGDHIGVFRALRDIWVDAPGVAIQIAPANLHWLSDAALEQAARLSEETGPPMHMHLLETPSEGIRAAAHGLVRRCTTSTEWGFWDRA